MDSLSAQLGDSTIKPHQVCIFSRDNAICIIYVEGCLICSAYGHRFKIGFKARKLFQLVLPLFQNHRRQKNWEIT